VNHTSIRKKKEEGKRNKEEGSKNCLWKQTIKTLELQSFLEF
jgi:hypothetical protein